MKARAVPRAKHPLRTQQAGSVLLCSATGGRSIEVALDYLVLSQYAADPGFQKAWRSFTRACSHRLKGLPLEAQAWIAKADEYDDGRITADEMTAFREADRFFSERFEQSTVEERGALSAAMHRLWAQLDTDPDGWEWTAWYFLHWCAGAGVEEPMLIELLRQHFGLFLAAKQTSLRQLIEEAEPPYAPSDLGKTKRSRLRLVD